jgi:hypothetical protein
MFGLGKIKSGDYVFAVEKENEYNKIILGRVQSVNKNLLSILGSYIKPTGLIAKRQRGILGHRSQQVLNDPDPDNCIFILIDRIETGNYYGTLDQNISKVIWINEKRFFVLEGWIKENMPDMFADVIYSQSEEEKLHYRSILIEKMNSLYDKDLKEHVYAVARSAKIL